MLTDSLRERVLRITSALERVRTELERENPTREVVQSFVDELARLDNTLERAASSAPDAPELAAFHAARLAVKDLGREVALRLHLEVPDSLSALAELLAAQVPLRWNGTGDGTVRWLTSQRLVLGRFSAAVSAIRRVGHVSRLGRDDVVWLELADAQFPSFVLADGPAKALTLALVALGVTRSGEHADAERGTTAFLTRAERHLEALRSCERNFGRQADLSELAAECVHFDAQRLEALAEQTALAGDEGRALRTSILKAREAVRALLRATFVELGEPADAGDDVPALATRLSPHLPFLHLELKPVRVVGERVLVSQRTLRLGERTWALKDLEQVDFAGPFNGSVVITAAGQRTTVQLRGDDEVTLARALRRASGVRLVGNPDLLG